MTLLLDSTSIDRDALLPLARYLSGDRGAFLQILLDFSSKRTFNRIKYCPLYPGKLDTPDLAERKRLFCESIASDPHDIPFALAFLYESAAEKERRKKRGQYFTPAHVSRKVITQISLKPRETLMDAGCGTGIFALSLLRELRESNDDPASFGYLGIENDPLLALSASVSLDWADAPEGWRVLYKNYLNVNLADIGETIGSKEIDAVISNPPYVRFHKLGERSDLADRLNLQALSGLHSYFLEHSIKLVPRRRMMFIVPMEMNRTKYGAKQLDRLRSRFKVDNEVAYYDERNHIWNIQGFDKISLEMHTKMKHAWNLMSFLPIKKDATVPQISWNDISKEEKATISLGKIASVRRGISTGANHFFVITNESAKEIGISEENGYMKRIIPTKIPTARLKDVFDEQEWDLLKEEGRPCWLLSLPKERSAVLPSGLKAYLRKGESLGVHVTQTCKNREPHNPWYFIKVQDDHVPDLFFTYVSRGSPVFIYNKARVHNLNNLLGVYLKISVILSEVEMTKLVRLLNSEIKEWIGQKSTERRYAGGMVKFEPRDLERLPVSKSALKELRIDLQFSYRQFSKIVCN
jgi:hypothetical protein